MISSVLTIFVESQKILDMQYVELPSDCKQLPFYLAVEEYIAAHGRRGEEYFFMWQVEPTVICGRNQEVDKEVDLDFCRRHGVNVCRRRSGGGAVVADMNNIMFSYVTLRNEDSNVATTFSRYTGAVAAFLQSLGLNAEATGRNDILVDGAKVSGYAFYHLPSASIVHGTMLWDMNPVLMSGVLTPSRAKLESSGVKSVQSRVTTVRPLLPSLTINDFKRRAREFMCGDNSITLGDDAIAAVERDYLPPYFASEWINRIRNTRARSRRIDGVGEFIVDVKCLGGKIERVNLTGDFFLLGDLDSGLLDRLKGVERSPEALAQALRGVDVSRIIHNLSTTALVELITEQPIKIQSIS